MHLLKRLIPIFYFVIISVAAIVFFIKNNINWDIIPYTACIKHIESQTPDINKVHTETYKIISQEVSQSAYEKLVDSSKRHRSKSFSNAIYFNEQLSYYKVKPGYNFINFIYKKITGSYTRGIALTSITGWLLVALLLPLWLKKHVSVIWTYILAILMLFLPFMIEAARTATPDMLSSAILLWVFYFIFSGKHLPAMILALLAIFIRPENAVVAGMLLAFIWLEFAVHAIRVQVIISMLLAVIIAICLIPMGGGSHNMTSLYEGGYLAHMVNGLRSINESFLPMLFLFMCILFAAGILSIKERTGRLVILLLLIASIKFILVSTLETRFFISLIIGQLVLAIVAVHDQKARFPSV